MAAMRSFAVVSCAILAAAACSSFGEGDEPVAAPDASAPDARAGDAVADAPSDVGSEASACIGGREGGNTCGSDTCLKGQTCCLAGATPFCIATSACSTTQVNCASPAECDTGEVCCQVSGGSTGTQCSPSSAPSCSFGAPLCVKDGDCKPGEHCREPDPSKMIAHWHCAPCPG